MEFDAIEIRNAESGMPLQNLSIRGEQCSKAKDSIYLPTSKIEIAHFVIDR
jgi:hypothetical protein